MNKIIILGLGLICLIFLMGCEGIDVSQISDEDMARIAEKAIVCDKPYIRFGSSCCLDQDENGICDKDENQIEKRTNPLTSQEPDNPESRKTFIPPAVSTVPIGIY